MFLNVKYTFYQMLYLFYFKSYPSFTKKSILFLIWDKG